MRKALSLTYTYILINVKSFRFVAAVVLYSGLMFFSTSSELQYVSYSDQTMQYYLRFAYTNGSTSYLLPVVCAIPAAITFCREYRSDFFCFVWHRAGKLSYSAASCISAAIIGFITAFLGSIFYLTVMSIWVPFANGNEQALQNAIDIYANGYLLAEGKLFLYYFLAIAVQSIFAAFMTNIAVLSSTFLLDPYLTVVSPMVIYIVVTNVLRLIGVTRLLNPYYVFNSLNYMHISLHPDFILHNSNNIINFSLGSCLYPFGYAVLGIAINIIFMWLTLKNKLERKPE